MLDWLNRISELFGRWPSSLKGGLGLLVLGLMLSIPHSRRRSRTAGAVLFVSGICWMLCGLPAADDFVLFWVMAMMTVASCAAAISMRNPVYAAIWFAISLLGVAGLLMQHHAQFLGVATIVVYAGAIVVTFLFVVMLAQPDGHENHDRLSWGRFAKPASVLAGGAWLGLLFGSLQAVLDGRVVPPAFADSVDKPAPQLAQLGNELFGTHLISVEVAGTLLLAALVGAIAIMIHGKERRSAGE